MLLLVSSEFRQIISSSCVGTHCVFLACTLCILYVSQVKILILKNHTTDLVCLTLSSGVSPRILFCVAVHFQLFPVGKNESVQNAFVRDTAYGNLVTSVFLRNATRAETNKGTSKAIEEYCRRAEMRGWSSGNLLSRPCLLHYRTSVLCQYSVKRVGVPFFSQEQRHVR